MIDISPSNIKLVIPACVSSSPAFLMMYSAYKLKKQGDNIQPWHTPFPIWNQSVFLFFQLDHISKVPTQIMGGKYYICSSLTFQNHPHPFSVVSHWSWNRWQMNFVSPSKQMTSAPKSLPGVIYILKCRGKIELLFLSKFPESVVTPFTLINRWEMMLQHRKCSLLL